MEGHLDETGECCQDGVNGFKGPPHSCWSCECQCLSAGMSLVFSLDSLSPSFSVQTNHAQTLISEFLDLPLQYIFLLCYSLVKSFIVVLRMVDSVPVGLTSV